MKIIYFWPYDLLLRAVCQTPRAVTSDKSERVDLLREHAAYCAVVPRRTGSTRGPGGLVKRGV